VFVATISSTGRSAHARLSITSYWRQRLDCNTPPPYGYNGGTEFLWLRSWGTCEVEALNLRSAAYLQLPGRDGVYHYAVAMEDRSRMNIPFYAAQCGARRRSLKQAKSRGPCIGKDIVSVGGMRA